MMAEELELEPTGAPERRRAPRPEPPAPKLAPRLRRLVDWIADHVEASLRGWTAYLAVCASCIAFIVWSVTMRMDALDENYALVVEKAALQRQFDELAEHYSRDELKSLMEKISSAETTIFADYAGLAGWLGQQADAAARHDLKLSYVMHDAVPARVRNVAEVPITLHIVAGEGGQQEAYARVLRYLRELVDGRWHLEMTEAVVNSDGMDVVSVDTTVHVWVDSE